MHLRLFWSRSIAKPLGFRSTNYYFRTWLHALKEGRGGFRFFSYLKSILYTHLRLFWSRSIAKPLGFQSQEDKPAAGP